MLGCRVANVPADAGVPLCLVTGAPGADNSAVAAVLLEQPGPLVIFDADWLLEPASRLAGKDITEVSETWPAYRLVWLRIVQMLARNGRRVAVFAPTTLEEIQPLLPLPGIGTVHWCLLDCTDETRRARLAARGWTPAAIVAALADARVLRERLTTVVDTSQMTAREAADRLRVAPNTAHCTRLLSF